MSNDGPSSLDYEMEALRLRARIGDTIEELRANFEPARLVDEVATAAGIDVSSPSASIVRVAQRHPIPSAAIAVGIGLLAYVSFARRKTNHGPAQGGSSLRRVSSSLIQSASKTLHERGEARRQQFVNAARARIADGATSIADRIDEAVEDLTQGLPGEASVRPLLQSGIQLVLSAALEAIVARFPR
jgi:hypothetical protein